MVAAASSGMGVGREAYAGPRYASGRWVFSTMRFASISTSGVAMACRRRSSDARKRRRLGRLSAAPSPWRPREGRGVAAAGRSAEPMESADDEEISGDGAELSADEEDAVPPPEAVVHGAI